MAQLKILVVGDSLFMFERLQTSFATEAPNVTVLSAISLSRARALAASQAPDVVLIDADLPDGQGYKLSNELRNDEGLVGTTIVMYAGNVDASAEMLGRQSGAAATISNLLEPREVLASLGEIMSHEPEEVAVPRVGSAGSMDTPRQGVPKAPGPEFTIDELLHMLIDRQASDLHITVGSPPGLRICGDLVPIAPARPLTQKDTQDMILALLSEEQRRKFDAELELDFAYSLPGLSRFRANVFLQRNSLGAVFRRVPLRVPSMTDLGLPEVCTFLAERPRGLVLVTGPTGSGKSTTLAAMINHINETRPCHIITLEDPIEFIHRNKRSYVNQREIGGDTRSFAFALKRVLRQDPDVILVGEMRDLETISAAITAAETGHLVFATLHTTGGPETIDRVVDVFPPHQQQQIRMQLSTTLEGVMSQVLVRSAEGTGRVLAMEIMLGVPAIGNLIREAKTHQMQTIIMGSQAIGMKTLDQDLKRLVQAGVVTYEEAIGKAKDPRELAKMLGRTL